MAPNASRKVLKPRRERGYVLLTLLLVLAIMSIAAAAIAPDVIFEIKRDREEELLHRGAQYTRAVRMFVKKTGRYPSKMEDLLGSYDQRFLRRMYKDPVTGKDFRLLHMADVQPLTTLNGASPVTQPASSAAPQINNQALLNGATNPQADTSQTTQPPNGPENATDTPGTASAGATTTNTPTNTNGTPSPAQASGQQPGLLIFGVASTSKNLTIREFYHKNHYNDWLFFYDPRVDQGYQIKGPTPPSAPVQMINGTNGLPDPSQASPSQPVSPTSSQSPAQN